MAIPEVVVPLLSVPVAMAERPAIIGRPVEPAMPDTANPPDGFGKPDKPEKPDKPDKPDKPEKPEKPDVPKGPPDADDHGRPEGTPAAVAITDIVGDLFTAFDTSAQDGTISLEEIKAVLAPNGKRVGLMGHLADIVADVDTSYDGKLSVAEVTAALGYLDTNDDGTIDRGDFGASADHDTAVALVGILMHLRPDGHHGPG